MVKNFISLIFLVCSQVVLGQNRQTENIFIVTLDGFRWQELFGGVDSSLLAVRQYTPHPDELKQRFWAATAEERRKLLLPFFWSELAQKGQLYGNRLYGNKVNCSNQMWFSYPGYNEILSGYADDARISSNDKVNNPNVTLLEFLNKMPGFKGKVAAFGSWDVFPFIINRGRSGITVNAGFETATGDKLSEREKFLNELQGQVPSPWGGVRLDAFTHHYAMEYIKKNKPRIVYIGYGETDDFAHDGRYDFYLKSAYQTDQFIASLWGYIQSTPQYKDKTTLLITTDHGRGTIPLDTWRSHGRNVSGSDEIWFAVIGPDTEPKGEIKVSTQLFQNQLAKTAAASLGIDYTNEKPTGAVIQSMLKTKP
jgi:hypothetical protein